MIWNFALQKNLFFYTQVAFLLCLFTTAPIVESAGAERSGEFLEGYVTALIETSYDMPSVEIEVRQGTVYLRNVPEDKQLRTKITERLLQIQGIEQVEWEEEIVSALPKEPTKEQKVINRNAEDYSGAFPANDLFTPLMADPLESRFSAAYRYDLEEERGIAAVSFGEVFGFYRWNDVFAEGHQIQIDLEAAVFAYFDLDVRSSDLMNVDFQVGTPVIYRYHDFSSRLRFMHRSSHYGDDYLARNPGILFDPNLGVRPLDDNLIDLTLSYEQPWWRVYWGSVYLFDTKRNTEPWEFIYGLEFTPWKKWTVHPIAGIHLRQTKESEWQVFQRYAAGIEISDWPFRNRTLRLLLEYYNGNNLQWPFIQEDGDYVGISAYFDF